MGPGPRTSLWPACPATPRNGAASRREWRLDIHVAPGQRRCPPGRRPENGITAFRRIREEPTTSRLAFSATRDLGTSQEHRGAGQSRARPYASENRKRQRSYGGPASRRQSRVGPSERGGAEDRSERTWTYASEDRKRQRSYGGPASDYRFVYWGALRARFRPYFLRSFLRGSRERRPAWRSGSRLASGSSWSRARAIP